MRVYNQFHNILRLLDVLANVPFTTSETMGMVNMAYKHGKYELPDEFPNDLRISGTYEISGNCLNSIE